MTLIPPSIRETPAALKSEQNKLHRLALKEATTEEQRFLLEQTRDIAKDYIAAVLAMRNSPKPHAPLPKNKTNPGDS